MKKIITAILAVNLILSAFAVGSYAENAVPELNAAVEVPEFAENSDITMVSADEVKAFVAKVKSKINVPDTLTEFDSSKSVYNGVTTYSFSWHDKDYENSVNVDVNDKGDISSYSTYFNEENSYGEFNTRYTLSALTDDEIKSIAKKWLTDIGVSYINEVDFDNGKIYVNIYDSTVSIYMERVVNGIAFPENYASVNINKNTKAVTGYYSNWNYNELPSAEGLISEEDAKAKYKQACALELVYVPDYSSEEKKAVLRYDIGEEMINAKTGEIEKNSVYYGYKLATADVAAGAMKEESGLTPEEIKGISELTSLISEEDAEKKALSLENTGLDKYGVNAYNYNKYDNKYTVDIEMEDENGSYARVTLDAVTGEVMSVFISDYYSYMSSKQNITLPENEAKAIADKFIEKYNSKKSEYKYFIYDYNTVQYVRMVNDIPYYNDKIVVSVDPESKTIFEYNANYSDNVSFEKKDGVLSEEKAYAKLFENVGFKLYYKEIYNDKTNGNDIKLVYYTGADSSYIDARTGKTEDIYNSEKIYPSDMAGHYAEKAVNALIRNGVITLTDDKFNPDNVLNQKEALEMLDVFFGWYEPKVADVDYDSFYKTIVRRGIISSSEKNPTETVVREKAVKYILHAIGYTNIKYIDESVFDSGFNDASSVSAEYNRYVAAAKGLGIVKGDENGNFNPQGQVTKGQFAIMIYNALTNQQ